MGSIRDPRPLVELTPIKDKFVSDLGRIEILNGNVRFVCWTEHFPEEGAEPLRVVSAKIVMPRPVIIPAINRTLFALGYAAISGGQSNSSYLQLPM